MVKRAFDLAAAVVLIVCTAPLTITAAVGVRLSGSGPIFYRAKRVGKDGSIFDMYKFRTMRAEHGSDASVITASDDPRIFWFGDVLRKTKIDELPQLFDVLRGDMSLVGPRPEDPKIVEEHYTEAYRETLTVRPGLASPGSIYNYTHAAPQIAEGRAETDYVDRILPTKMALERVYVRRASFGYDLRIIARAAWAIVSTSFGRKHFPDPPEMAVAQREGWLPGAT